MLGWLCWSEGQERAGRAELAGLPVLRVPVRRKNGTPEWLLRRRVRAAGRTLARAGVRRVILPEGFSYGALLAGEGVFPVETLPLWRSLAAELAWRALRERGAGGEGAAGGRWRRCCGAAGRFPWTRRTRRGTTPGPCGGAWGRCCGPGTPGRRSACSLPGGSRSGWGTSPSIPGRRGRRRPSGCRKNGRHGCRRGPNGSRSRPLFSPPDASGGRKLPLTVLDIRKT